MAKLIWVQGSYRNKNAIGNAVRYITRTRAHENRGNELVCFGGSGVSSHNPDLMVRQFKAVQNEYHPKNTRARKICHEVLALDEQEDRVIRKDIFKLCGLAGRCCLHYYELGFQAAYAVHDGIKEDGRRGLHVHFVINTTSYITGKKMHDYRTGTEERERLFNLWLGEAIRLISAEAQALCPIIFGKCGPQNGVAAAGSPQSQKMM